MRRISIIVVFLLQLAFWSTAATQKFSFLDEENIWFNGEILPGDTERFKDWLMSNLGYTDVHGNWFSINLNSPGGDLSESIQLANFIHSNGILTKIRSTDICLSACAWMFLAGRFVPPSAYTGMIPSRTIEYGGKLGFHNFSIGTNVVSSGISDEELIEMGLNTAQTANNFLTTLLSQWENVDLALISDLMRTPSDEIRYIETIGAARRLGIHVVFPDSISSAHRRTENACINEFARAERVLLREATYRIGETRVIDKNNFWIVLYEGRQWEKFEGSIASLWDYIIETKDLDLFHAITGIYLDNGGGATLTKINRGGGIHIDACIATTEVLSTVSYFFGIFSWQYVSGMDLYQPNLRIF